MLFIGSNKLLRLITIRTSFEPNKEMYTGKEVYAIGARFTQQHATLVIVGGSAGAQQGLFGAQALLIVGIGGNDTRLLQARKLPPVLPLW